MNLFKNNRGATAVEFALVALPVFVFIYGIMQVSYVVWVDNLLHISVNAAARCGAVKSTTSPCNGTDMGTTANTVFSPLSGATFNNNSGCSASGGAGLIGTYNVPVLGTLLHVTVTAKSCYPTISS